MSSPSSPSQLLASLAVDNLQQLQQERPANMSRGRFVFMQLNSLIIAILTCVTFILIWMLTRVETITELVSGPCSLGMILLRNLTGLPDFCSVSLSIFWQVIPMSKKEQRHFFHSFIHSFKQQC